MKPELSRNEPVPRQVAKLGRGNLMFPEWTDLDVSNDGGAGDCLIYPDTPHNRKHLVWAKCNYNRRDTGTFAGKRFVHRYETRHGEPVIVIQRIV